MDESVKKHYKNVDEQIEYLVKNKNIKKDTINRELLVETSYMSLITPYTILVCKGRDSRDNNRHIYDKDIDFSYYVNWFNIDRYICSKLQIAIGDFERKLKSFLSDEISRMMSEAGDASCSNYDIFLKYLNGEDILKLLNINSDYDRDGKPILVESSARKKAINTLLETATSKDSSNSLIKHYAKRGYIPFWILIHTLTINELIQLFKMLPMESRTIFLEKYMKSRVVNARDVYKLTSKLNDIRILRNIVNHYEPVIPFILNYDDRNKDSLFNTVEFLITKNKRIELDGSEDLTILTPENEYNKARIARVKRVVKIISR